MKPPFKLPARASDERFLVAANCELVAELVAATPKEVAYIVTAVNLHDDLMKLLDCAELNQDDLEPETRELLAVIQATLKDLP